MMSTILRRSGVSLIVAMIRSILPCCRNWMRLDASTGVRSSLAASRPVRTRLDGRALDHLVLCFGQRLIEDGHRQIDFDLGHRQRWRDAPDRSAFGTAPNVHAEAEVETALRGQRSQLVMRLARLAIL